MINWQRHLVGFVAVVAACLPLLVQGATRAGETIIARGVASAVHSEHGARLIGPGALIYEGDTITTGPRSMAMVKLDDGSRIMIRPETSFKVEGFSIEPQQERAVMRMFKGGLRVLTGFISKRNPNAMRLNTAVATIGIRGTEFDARLCAEDCAEEAKRRPAPAGRTGFVKGSVVARAPSGTSRALEVGDAVFNGDTVLTAGGAYSVLVFRDGGRVTILPNTEFQIQRFQYAEAEPQNSRSFFRLVRGGLRAVTGAIGKQRRNRYRMRTPVATIGIRGTGYDLLCQGTCVNPGGSADPSGDGLFADVLEGSIDFDGANPTGAGNTVFIGDVGLAPIAVPGMPQPLGAPPPNEVPIPTLPPIPAQTPAEGLYVSCYAGNCNVQTEQNVVDLQAGQASFVGGDAPAVELPEIPAFQAEDPVYTALEFGELLNVLDGSIDGGDFECTVQ